MAGRRDKDAVEMDGRRIDDPIEIERLGRLNRIEQSADLLRKQSVDTKEAVAALLRGGPGEMKEAVAYLLHGGSVDTEVAAPGLLRGMFPNTDKPGPQRFRKRQKPAVYDVSRQFHACVKVAMEHYNRLHEDDVHQLVRAADGRHFLYNGEWWHVNFIAKSKQLGTPKPFFAELEIGVKEISCTMCTDMDLDNPKTAPVRGECGVCPRRIFHPAAGEFIGANPGPGDCRAEHLGAAPGGGSEEFASLCNAEIL